MRYLFLCCFCLLLCPNHGSADQAESFGVGLVLGGGGARGAAHIGVLRVLERERIPVSHIGGTSMGSIVGGLYAAGYNADEIESILGSVDWRDMFSDDPSREVRPLRRKEDDYRFTMGYDLGFRDGQVMVPRGVLQGQKLLLLLRRMLWVVDLVDDFDQLPIPFRCVAASLSTGEGKVFNGGDLVVAIRSSMSVPGAFAPLRVDGELLVDGGIVDNVPLDVVRAMGADKLVVVDVGAPLLRDEQIGSPLSVGMQMINILMKQQTDLRLRELRDEDIYLQPDLGEFSSAAFDRALETVPAGVAAAEAQIERLRAHAVDQASWDAWQAHRRVRLQHDRPMIEFLQIVQDRSRTHSEVGERLQGQIGRPLDPEVLEQAIQQTYAAGRYERIDWRLIEKDGQLGALLNPVDKGWGPNYLRFGLALSDNFDGASSYQLRAQADVTGLTRFGAEWRTRIDLGRETGLKTEFYAPFGNGSPWYLEPQARWFAIDQPVVVDGRQQASFRYSTLLGTAGVGYELSEGNRLTLSWLTGRTYLRRKIGSGDFPEVADADIGALALRYRHDTLNSASFPDRGRRSDLALELHRDSLRSDGDGEVLRVVHDRAFASEHWRYLIGGRYLRTQGSEIGLQSFEGLGGFGDLSGLDERALADRQLLYGRFVAMRRFGDAQALFSVPSYLGFSVEAGNTYDQPGDISAGSLIKAGSVFVAIDTLVGPIFVGYGHASNGSQSLYLRFGSLLRARD